MGGSFSWVVLFVGGLVVRAPLFGVYTRAPEFWKPPNELPSTLLVGSKDMH